MELLKGLFFINDIDIAEQYGAFLTEEKEGEHTNYSALMKPPASKTHTAVECREDDGEELPEELVPAFKSRDVTLTFAIIAATPADFFRKYSAFFRFLGSGWLELRLPELYRTFRMYYSDCTEYKQLTIFEDGTVGANFKVKLYEPKPEL